MFNFFKHKPKRCQQCGCEQKRLHSVYSDYYKNNTNEVPIEICTPCLSRMFLESLQAFSARAVFVEPISEDGYVFIRFCDEPDKLNMVQPIESYLAPSGTTCSVCSKPTQFCWLPLEVEVDPGRNQRLRYQDKSTFADYDYLCAEHLLAKFIECVEKNQFYFLTLRLPVGDSAGFCY